MYQNLCYILVGGGVKDYIQMIIFKNWIKLICLNLITTAKINITKIKICIALSLGLPT